MLGVFIKRKKRNLLRPARWSARNPVFSARQQSIRPICN